MKIALLTIWREKNFGAEMQCYATVRALRELGHEAEVIDFRLSDDLNLSFKHRLMNLARGFSPETRSFEQFWHKYIPATPHYSTETALKQNPPAADLYLAGSDQVWNPDITKDKWDAYFLNFGGESVRRVSYASSFGEEKWEWPDKLNEASRLLRRFEALSVREQTGVELLSQQFGVSSTLVLDPTLLHEDYDELSPIGAIGSSPVVYYPLVANPELETFARDLAKTLGLDFIDTNRRSLLMGKITWRRTTIREWLGNIKNAGIVVTPSFHGLAFSLIFKRQFIIVQNARGRNRNSRITGLLKELGLEDRYFTSIEEARQSRIWERTIDYSNVSLKLRYLREFSWTYLRVALK